jgi:hypothetical protein
VAVSVVEAPRHARDWTCECPWPCDEKMRLTETEYRRLSDVGERVVHALCRDSINDLVVARVRDVAAVVTRKSRRRR